MLDNYVVLIECYFVLASPRWGPSAEFQHDCSVIIYTAYKKKYHKQSKLLTKARQRVFSTHNNKHVLFYIMYIDNMHN